MSVKRNPMAASDPARAAAIDEQLMSEFSRRRAEAMQQEQVLTDPSLTAPQQGTAHERFEADPLAATAPHFDQEMQRRMRDAYERGFPRAWRWLRRQLRIGEQVYSQADATGARLNAIYADQRTQSLFNAEVASNVNQQATWLNALRAALKETNERLAYYERFVPQLKRAKAEYDRQRASMSMSKERDDTQVAPP